MQLNSPMGFALAEIMASADMMLRREFSLRKLLIGRQRKQRNEAMPMVSSVLDSDPNCVFRYLPLP
jgi:hypothetical protein